MLSPTALFNYRQVHVSPKRDGFVVIRESSEMPFMLVHDIFLTFPRPNCVVSRKSNKLDCNTERFSRHVIGLRLSELQFDIYNASSELSYGTRFPARKINLRKSKFSFPDDGEQRFVGSMKIFCKVDLVTTTHNFCRTAGVNQN